MHMIELSSRDELLPAVRLPVIQSWNTEYARPGAYADGYDLTWSRREARDRLNKMLSNDAPTWTIRRIPATHPFRAALRQFNFAPGKIVFASSLRLTLVGYLRQFNSAPGKVVEVECDPSKGQSATELAGYL